MFVMNPAKMQSRFAVPVRWLAVGCLTFAAFCAPPTSASGQESATSAATDTPPKIQTRPSVRLELDTVRVVMSGHFSEGPATQTVEFERPVKGRYFCLESLSAQDGRPFAAVAELNLLAGSGQPLSRKDWSIVYADSEEQERENGSAENAIDGDPFTYWHTQWSRASPHHPHHLVIDLGQSRSIAGFSYVPRPGGGTVGGRIGDYRIYVGDDLVAQNALDKSPPAKAYLFSYFTGTSTDGLHLGYSLNGYRWNVVAHGGSLLKPEVGQELMRDPCLLLGPDGIFRLVWTAGWNGNYIGYASSTDLIHWSPQMAIPVMTNEPETLNCWAPEIFWDQRHAEYILYWSSSVSNRFGGAVRPDNNRIYCTTTKDFKGFSATRLFFDPGFSVLDATMVQSSNRFYLFFKDDTIMHLRMAVADDARGPFSRPGPAIEPDFAQGPAVLKVGGQTICWYHIISEKRFGSVKTSDLEHWEDISAGMFLPPQAEQGTVLEISGEKLAPLVAAGLLETGTTPEASELAVGDWIWTTTVADRQACHLWRAFNIPSDTAVVRAELRMTADNSYTVYLDGREIGRGGDANSLAQYDLTWLLSPGRHVLAVEAFNDTLDAGVLLGLRVQLANGRKLEVFSDPSWRIATGGDRNWRTTSQADAAWPPAEVVGYAGRAWWQHPYKVVQVPPLQPVVVRFWQQGWVLAILLLACLVVAVLWVRQGLRLALQSRAQQLLERERARIARDMHDDLGSGLTQLTLLGELVLRETLGEGEARNRLNELCAKARYLLRSMDEIVWTVNPHRDTVKDFAAFISEYAQEYLTATAIRCRQEVMDELPAIPLGLPQRRNLLLAVKEALRNAARHSGADEVTLKVLLVDNFLKVVVADNGCGFSTGRPKDSRNGLLNMKQRLADIGGSFTLYAAPGQGCSITFLLPLPANEITARTNP